MRLQKEMNDVSSKLQKEAENINQNIWTTFWKDRELGNEFDEAMEYVNLIDMILEKNRIEGLREKTGCTAPPLLWSEQRANELVKRNPKMEYAFSSYIPASITDSFKDHYSEIAKKFEKKVSEIPLIGHTSKEGFLSLKRKDPERAKNIEQELKAEEGVKDLSSLFADFDECFLPDAFCMPDSEQVFRLSVARLKELAASSRGIARILGSFLDTVQKERQYFDDYEKSLAKTVERRIQREAELFRKNPRKWRQEKGLNALDPDAAFAQFRLNCMKQYTLLVWKDQNHSINVMRAARKSAIKKIKNCLKRHCTQEYLENATWPEKEYDLSSQTKTIVKENELRYPLEAIDRPVRITEISLEPISALSRREDKNEMKNKTVVQGNGPVLSPTISGHHYQ